MSTLKVYPNPWLATDKDGLPCAVVPTDPEGDGGGPGQFVGARIDRKRTQVLQDFGDNAKHELRSPMQRTRYEYMGTASDDPALAQKLFACDPIEIPRTKYYKQRIREGALFAADAETAAAGKVRLVPVADLVKRYAPPAPPAPPVLQRLGADLAAKGLELKPSAEPPLVLPAPDLAREPAFTVKSKGGSKTKIPDERA